MKTFKNILLATVLSFTMLNAKKELTLEINDDKVLQAIEMLRQIEDGDFEHQKECEFCETEYCTCLGNYLALIQYNRVLQAKQLLCDAIEVRLEDGESEEEVDTEEDINTIEDK